MFESLGGWDSKLVTLVKKITRHIARNKGRGKDQSNKFTFQKVSVALMQGNGLILTGHKPGNLSPELDGFM